MVICCALLQKSSEKFGGYHKNAYLCRRLNIYFKIMIKVQVSKVKPGEYVHLKDDENSPLWIRGPYDRSSRSYSLVSYNDSCHELFCKAHRNVFVELPDSIR